MEPIIPINPNYATEEQLEAQRSAREDRANP
jgi:hypothetical protein